MQEKPKSAEKNIISKSKLKKGILFMGFYMNNVRGKYHFIKHKLEVPWMYMKIEGKRSTKNESTTSKVFYLQKAAIMIIKMEYTKKKSK